MKRMKSILAILLALLVLSAAAFAEEIVPVEAPAEPAVEAPVEAPAPEPAAPEEPAVEAPVEAPAPEPAAPAEPAPQPEAPAEPAPQPEAPAEPEAPVEAPTEAPVVSEPTAVPATPAPTATPAIQVEVGDATGEEIEIEDEAEVPKGLDPVPFTGSVRIEVLDGGEIYFGDRITLVARVANASADYNIRWEVNKTGRANDWQTISNETQHQYDFIITPENADFNYRVVLTAAA